MNRDLYPVREKKKSFSFVNIQSCLPHLTEKKKSAVNCIKVVGPSYLCTGMSL
jgi:hypothetical protein